MDKTDMHIQTRTAAGTGSEGEYVCPAAQLETSDFVWFSHTEPDGQKLYGETRPFFLQ
mgnify:FL=1